MISFAVALAMLAHVLFWGAGLATIIMPRPWRRFWPVLVPIAGFALQGLVVWIGCYLNLRGTNQYAWPSEFVPLALLFVAVRQRGWRLWLGDWERFGLIWAATFGVLLLTMLPLAIASHSLTSVSLGSCDAADYAAGARVLMEFAHHDRSGFIGLTEVVHIASVDNFFDFWLRLNHFTPSALIALNGSILRCAPHELTSIATGVILAASLPTVFWSARTFFGYSPIASLILTVVYGISPIAWYSFAQVSPAPLLVANALALLNWAAVSLWNCRVTRTRAASFFAVLAVGFSLVLGAYNFILIVALVPAIAYAGARTIRFQSWRKLGCWLFALAVPLIVASLVFWARVAGLIERFLLFQTYDFGWRIPALGPEGWLGLVRGPYLSPWPFLLRWPLACLAVAALSWGIVEARARKRRLWLIGSVVLPILIGYGYLEIRGIVLHTNASYDAFKLFAVFYPLLLPAFSWWITLRWSSQLWRWLAVAALSTLIVAGNLVAWGMFVFALCRPPLVVDGELRGLRTVDTDPTVESINLLIPDMWSRLWANEQLLHKPQYFLTHTYEGRLNTPLRGDWDLQTAVVSVQPPGTRRLSEHYLLADTRAPGFFRAAPGSGWHTPEQVAFGDRWCWTQNDAALEIDNPQSHAIVAHVTLDGRAVAARDVAFASASQREPEFVRIGTDRAVADLGQVTIPPGHSRWFLRAKQAPEEVGGDPRPLNVCVYALTLDPIE